MSHLLDEIVQAQKRGVPRGITSICSTHPWVLKAVLSRAITGTTTSRAITGTTTSRVGTGTNSPGESPVLVESTCNQVNQFGGYTGMDPSAFVAYIHNLAAENGFPIGRLVLGGDHLGPNVWRHEPAETALEKSADLVRAYIQAGYTKIHLDASMNLGDDDPSHPLEVELAARRTARLAKAAEKACSDFGLDYQHRYVIGTEVPIPGGAIEYEAGVSVTNVEAASHTLEVTRMAFLSEGLEAAWERVLALVVQPGVEFGDDFILDYNPAAASELTRFAETIPFVYEAHSTDYQTVDNLRCLVRDHFAILKVGPALTFAYREAVFGLAMMENELFAAEKRSNIIDTLEEVMTDQPEHWQEYYRGEENSQRLARKFSRSDRIRYYWGNPRVQFALGRLLQNLRGKKLPLTLVSQFLPVQYERIRSGQINNSSEAVILDKVYFVLDEYASACG